MKMNIFGKEADFDQIAIAVRHATRWMAAIDSDPGAWSHDTSTSDAIVMGYPVKREITFDLHYNYRQSLAFKELELIRFSDLHNFHSISNKSIDPLGLYAPHLYALRAEMDLDNRGFFLSHLGIHCSEEEAEEWRALFSRCSIGVAFEDWSKKHTNPVIAGKRFYHNVIFASREALGFNFKACVRRNV